jgi:hypothetical protein
MQNNPKKGEELSELSRLPIYYVYVLFKEDKVGYCTGTPETANLTTKGKCRFRTTYSIYENPTFRHTGHTWLRTYFYSPVA